jgi:hypothetical protein
MSINDYNPYIKLNYTEDYFKLSNDERIKVKLSLIKDIFYFDDYSLNTWLKLSDKTITLLVHLQGQLDNIWAYRDRFQ